MMLLTGDDDIADIMLGRLPAHTNAELSQIITKIIFYEQQRNANAAYMDRMLWLADDEDSAGDFCLSNDDVIANNIPAGLFTHEDLCLDDATYNTSDPEKQNTTLIRNHFTSYISNQGAGIMNYRGHGAMTNWGIDIFDLTLNDNQLLFWANFELPTVIISADCLDGYFTNAGEEALSEKIMAHGTSSNYYGSVAHWSSVGLGFNDDHNVLHAAFYDGLYAQNLGTIGAAIQYAKERFLNQLPNKEYEAYEFLLQGDPAMMMPKSGEHSVFVPIVIK